MNSGPGDPSVERAEARSPSVRDGCGSLRSPHPVAGFIGVDAPEFNLRLLAHLRARGIRTVQYVSPQVWAWREGRVRLIVRAVDLMLVLFPFEEVYYRNHRVPVRFVGHPLADEPAAALDRASLREALGLSRNGPLLTLLPGSRSNEWRHHVTPFIETAVWLHDRHTGLRFAVAAVSEQARTARFRAAAVSKLVCGVISGLIGGCSSTKLGSICSAITHPLNT